MDRIEVYRQLEELESIRSSWKRLQEHSRGRTVYTTYEWMTSWWRAFGTGREMYVVGVWRDDELSALAPLAFTDSQSVPQAGALRAWSNDHTPRAGILAAEGQESAIQTVAAHLATAAPKWSEMGFDTVLPGSTLAKLGKALEGMGCRLGIEESIRSPYLEVPGTWDELELRLSKGTRKKTRQRTNSL